MGLGGGLYLGAARNRPEPAPARESASLAAAPEAPAGPGNLAEPSRSAAPAVSVAAVLPKSTRSAATEGPSDDDLREKLRKVLKLTIKAKGKADATMDPETAKVVLEFMTEFGAKLQAPSSDPSFYSRVVRLSLDVIFEELGIPLTDAQKSSMASAFERLRSQLEQGRSACIQDRTIGELRGYREVNDALKSLTDEQIAKMAEFSTPSTMFPLGGTRTVVLNMVQDPAEEVVREWTQIYQLGDSQKSAATAAARTFVEAWDQVDRRFEAQYGHRPGERPAGATLNSFVDQTAAAVDYSIATLEVQREALRLLEGSLTPEQLEKMHGTVMSQFKRATALRGTADADR
jgi:hypothetical protein